MSYSQWGREELDMTEWLHLMMAILPAAIKLLKTLKRKQRFVIHFLSKCENDPESIQAFLHLQGNGGRMDGIEMFAK